MYLKNSTDMQDLAARALFGPRLMPSLQEQASAALGGLVATGSDEHAAILDRVARARCAEWLDREHGMDVVFARELVNAILDLYADSTRVRR